jgi:hypothetical protein
MIVFCGNFGYFFLQSQSKTKKTSLNMVVFEFAISTSVPSGKGQCETLTLFL